MRIIYYVILVFLLSCEAVPDEISASGFTSRYEFLGASSLKGDGNDSGDEQGVMLTATYKLKPQTIRLVEPIRVNSITQSKTVVEEKAVVDKQASVLSKDYLGEQAKKVTNNLVNNALGSIIDKKKEEIQVKNLLMDYLDSIFYYKNYIIILIFFAFLLLIIKRVYNNKK